MKSAEDQLRKLLDHHWRKKTLADLRKEAEREFNGTAFETIRADKGPRALLVICATGQHEIRLVEKALDLQADDEPWLNWESQTVFDLVLHTEMGVGISYQDQRDAKGNRCAIVICATRPENIQMLESLFGL